MAKPLPPPALPNRPQAHPRPQKPPYRGLQAPQRSQAPYQWTAIDPVTRSKFLAYSYEKSFTNGLAFLLPIALWLRAFGFFHTLYFQTDWGEEFGGKSLRKLQRLQKRIFDPANVQLKRIRKGCWIDNACVERTHRTDDEEFHAPPLPKSLTWRTTSPSPSNGPTPSTAYDLTSEQA